MDDSNTIDIRDKHSKHNEKNMDNFMGYPKTPMYYNNPMQNYWMCPMNCHMMPYLWMDDSDENSDSSNDDNSPFSRQIGNVRPRRRYPFFMFFPFMPPRPRPRPRPRPYPYYNPYYDQYYDDYYDNSYDDYY